MDEQAEYSVLSKAAYDFFHGGEALAQSELQEYGLGDHRIDEALSDGNAVVITRPDGSAVVSYRGTDHISDLAPDFQIALGYHHNPMLQSMGAAALLRPLQCSLSHLSGARFFPLLVLQIDLVHVLFPGRSSSGDAAILFSTCELTRSTAHLRRVSFKRLFIHSLISKLVCARTESWCT